MVQLGFAKTNSPPYVRWAFGNSMEWLVAHHDKERQRVTMMMFAPAYLARSLL